MFELFIELSKKHSLKGNGKSSALFQYLLVGPLLLIATLTLTLFKLYLSRTWTLSWTICLALSLAISLLIIVFSLREGAFLFSELVKQRQDTEEDNQKLQQQIDALKVSSHQEKEQVQRSLNSMHMQLKEAEKRAESFEELTTLKKHEWEALEEEKETLFQERVAVQQDLDVFVARNNHLNAQLSELRNETQSLREELAKKQELQLPPHPYEELRKQFEEKSAVLSATRKELFAMEGKYLTVQKEMEDKLLEPQQDLRQLLTQFNALESYCNRLEDDLMRHQELLTELSVKKPVRRKIQTISKKIKVDETTVADLFAEIPKKKAKVMG